MTTTLICTVGGSHQPIITAIGKLHPDHVCFVCSGDDPATGSKGSYIQITGKGNVIKAHPADKKATLPNIPAQTGLADDQFEVLEVQPDDLDDVYHKVSAWLAGQDRNETSIVADYTGGTKTMSAGLVLAALDHEGVKLQLVSGSRSNLVRVESGEEQVIPASVEESRFRRQLRRALSAWSRYAYDESAALLRSLSAPSDATLRGEWQRAIQLSEAFSAWDRFDHATAQQILSRYRPVVGRHWGPLLGTLDLLLHEERGEPVRLLDLWRNAERRAAQGRYDDAVARSYRLLEWTAQWILRSQAGIDTADIPADRIPADLELTKNRSGQYQAGLFDAWALAAEYGGEAVASFWQSQRDDMLNLLKLRNHSILAHGFAPIDEGQWKDFAAWISGQLLPLLLRITAADPYRVRQLSPQLPTELPSA